MTTPSATPGPDATFAARLAAARTAVTELAAAADQLDDVPGDEMAPVMGELTTMCGQLDGLRVAVTAQVRRRGLYRRRGAADTAGWLRGDARTADVAASLSRLAGMESRLPQITGLLQEGSVSLAQAGTACWQIAQLPPVVTRPDQADPDTGAPASPEPGPGAGPDEGGEDAWAGLWRGGDVHAAADDLFARFLPGMDPAQLRVLGAHLREAADAQDRARDDYNTHAARSLRISRGLEGTAHLSGHLHPEAAEQVLAAFEELGAKAGPGDTRTKPQRWADALAYLTSLICPTQPAPAPDAPTPGTPGAVAPAGGTRAAGDPPSAEDPVGEPDDDEPCPDGGHGHPHPEAAVDPAAAGAAPDAVQPQAGPATAGPGTRPAGTGTAGTGTAGTGTAGTGTAGTGTAGTGTAGTGTAGTGTAVPAGLRRPRVIVTVPLSTLLGAPLGPGAVLGAGTPLTAEAARRLACDADIIRLITSHPSGSPPGHSPDPDGQWNATAQLTRLLAAAIGQLPRPLGGPSAALDIGRQSQSWTPRQRDALFAQYGGRCARPGCTRRIDVIHHIVHWLFGGRTQTINGAPLCLYDHWLVHEGGWRISKDPSGALTFIPPPPGWQPGTLYRRGKPIPETNAHPHAA